MVGPGSPPELAHLAAALEDAAELRAYLAPFANGSCRGATLLKRVPTAERQLSRRRHVHDGRLTRTHSRAALLEMASVLTHRPRTLRLHEWLSVGRDRRLASHVMTRRDSRSFTLVPLELLGRRASLSVDVAYAATVHPAAALRDVASELSPAHESRLRRSVVNIDAALSRARYLWVPSRYAAVSYLEAGFPENRIVVAGLGVDLNLFRPSPGRASGRGTGPALSVLYAGRISAGKGLSVLRAAVEGQSRISTLLVGPSDGTIDCESSGNFRLREPVSRDQLAGLMRAADVVVLPSLCDSFGMTVLEALASGTPVIATDRVGASSVVEEGKNGLVVQAGSVDSLRSALHRMLETPNRPELRRRARETAEDHSWVATSRAVARELLLTTRSHDI